MSVPSSNRQTFEQAPRKEVAKYRAPRGEQSRLCVPEISSVGALLDGNRQTFQSASVQWMDVPLKTIRRWSRDDLIGLARDYTKEYWSQVENSSELDGERCWLESVTDDGRSDAPLILSGHQPELFHPGVWFKNFLLSSLAKQHSGIGVNILVDHDLARTFALGVPVRTLEGQLIKETVPIDEDWRGIPWENAFPKKLSNWKSFDALVASKLSSVGIRAPLICELWPDVILALEKGMPVGEALASARHTVELSNGLKTLELPFSRLATRKSFACFVGELLSKIETIHESYNVARNEYRVRNGIKNHLQPIPELARDGDWIESPFWIYSDADPTRRPLWVQRGPAIITLSDRQQWSVELPCDGKFETWFAAWQKLVALNISIRPRALTTTMFLRLAVGDLFIHGIGGGKYDQLTDQIIETFWPLFAPKFVVATATLRLPIKLTDNERFEVGFPSEKSIHDSIRDWRFSPERLIKRSRVDDVPGHSTFAPEARTDFLQRDSVSVSGTIGNLLPAARLGKKESSETEPREELDLILDEKRALLSHQPTREEKPAWHWKIQRINATIREISGISEEFLALQLREARSRDRDQAILNSREFSLALFPLKLIVEPLRRLSAAE